MFSSRRRALPLAAAVVLALSPVALAADPSAAPQVAATGAGTVTINNFEFQPPLVTVAPGTTVTWINRDEEPHTVLSADGGATFKSPALDTDDKFAFTFDKPGTYKYFCSLHRHMVGTIVVK
ncbi:MAG TPA: plastocyanin/azurin family copper-binding protein [Stellaceae bacterium]|nr:plastocyanin/azurin family copper-binding protein [Stellaceae bacterium]